MGIQRYGPMGRGNPGSFSFGVYGVNGGVNVKSVPEEIGDNDLAQGLNVYLTAAGGVQMRNGITTTGTPTGTGVVQGLARFYQQVLDGAEVTPVTAKTLVEVGGELYDLDTGDDLGSVGGTDAHPWTFVRVTDPNDPHTTGGNTDVIIFCTGKGGPYVWDGTNLYTPTGWADAVDASWCSLVNGTVWFGGFPTQPQTVLGTGDGITASMESLPGYNVFVMSQPVTGLCAYGTGASAALVIGMNRGLSVLYGTGPDNYVLQDVPSDDGVLAGRTMVYNNGVIFFLGRQAVYAFNGQSPPIRISDKVEPWILNDGYVGGYPMDGDRSTSWAQVYNNRLHVGYESNGVGHNNTILCFDLVVDGWTVLQTAPGLNCMTLLDAPGDPSPAACIAGSSTTKQSYNWDVETTGQEVATDAGADISALFQSKFYKIGIPGTNKSLTRVYPEFFLPGPVNGQLFVQTDYGTTYNAAVVVQAGSGGGQWGSVLWGAFDWTQGASFQPFVSPASRLDFDGVQGDAYAFGFATAGQSAPWQFGGATGVLKQLGRT